MYNRTNSFDLTPRLRTSFTTDTQQPADFDCLSEGVYGGSARLSGATTGSRRNTARAPVCAVPSAPAYMDSASNPPEPSSSDASTFERWRRKFSMITGVGGTKEERAADMDAKHHTTCEKWKMELMTYS